MGPNHLSWIYQVSQLTFVLVFCMLLLLPVSSAYSLQESDVPTYKEKRDTPNRENRNGLKLGSGVGLSPFHSQLSTFGLSL
ncbi:neuroactive polyprotein R15 [Biomphalaria glabrata]|nr:neuroactive polyprotein R15 [Biomphalaria glabrata]